ncbi:MAG: cytochrome c [Bacteriovorax sp.]|nr:cytochrome c [Bacteriovorax sp.]
MNSMKLFLFTFSIITCSISPLLHAQDAAKGAELYKQCIACHGEKGDGNLAQKAPRLAGQHDWYVLKQLQDIKAGVTRKNPVMIPFLNKLNEQDMKDLAAYISKL